MFNKILTPSFKLDGDLGQDSEKERYMRRYNEIVCGDEMANIIIGALGVKMTVESSAFRDVVAETLRKGLVESEPNKWIVLNSESKRLRVFHIDYYNWRVEIFFEDMVMIVTMLDMRSSTARAEEFLLYEFELNDPNCDFSPEKLIEVVKDAFGSRKI